jgi:hypothetical protein
MIYMWFTGNKYIMVWPLRKIVSLSLRPLRPYGNLDLTCKAGVRTRPASSCCAGKYIDSFLHSFLDFDRIEPLSLKHKASNEVRLKEGSTATLTCSPTPSDAVEVIWKNISRKTGERCRKLPNGSLEIRDISQSESTLRITCEFSSDKGVSAKRSIGIHVAQSGMCSYS